MFEIIFTSGNGDTVLQDDEFQAGNYGFSGTGAAANTTLTLNLDGTLFTVTTNGAGEFTLDPTAVATGGTLNGQTLAAVMATLGEGPVSLFETVSNAFVAFTVDRQAPNIPAITAPDAQNFGFDTTGNTITGLSVADADTATLTITLTVQGALTLAQTTGLTFTTGDGADDSTMTFSGTVADINAAIATLGYAPANGDRDGDQLDIRVDDGTAPIVTPGVFPASFNLSSLDGTNGFVMNGVAAGDYTARSVSSAGDVNGDGIDDLLINAERVSVGGTANVGATYIVFGRDTAVDGNFAASLDLSSLDGSNGFVINGPAGEFITSEDVSSAGDVNGDGIDDILIGSRFSDPGGRSNAGEAFVVFGRDTAEDGDFAASFSISSLDGTNGFVLSGIDASDSSGSSVSAAGDVNGDGIDDFMIGARLADPGGRSNAGETYIVFGRDTAADGNFAASFDLSSLNGTNGFVINGVAASDVSGSSVASAGDVNGDGIDDLLIGADSADPGGDSAAGATYVVFGRNTAADGAFAASFELSSLDGTNGFVINGIDANDRSGFPVASAGDINGDGIDDLLIGAYQADPGDVSSAGEAYVVFGRNTAVDGNFSASLDLSSLDGTNGFVINGIDETDRAGFAISSAGDVNGDGHDDIIVAGYLGDPNGVMRAGETFIIFGRDTAADGDFAASFNLSSVDGTNGFVINGIDESDYAGVAVSAAGDVNNDGIDDILIGAWNAEPGGLDTAGEGYVVFGSATIAEQFASQSVTINLSNTAPTVSAPVVLTAITEDSTAITITLAQLLANAADANGDTLSVLGLTASSGTLIDNMDDTWSFTPAANDDTNVTFTYSVSDNVAPAVPTTTTLDLTPVNDLPTVTAPGAQDFQIGSTGNQITGLSVGDVDTGETLTITLTVQGALTLAQTTGLTFTTGDGTDDNTMTFSGTVADINAAIATLGYAPANGDRDGDQLDIQVSDGAFLTTPGTFAASLELSALDGANGFVINGIDASDRSGISVSSAGDVNGDGVDDVLIGAYFGDPDGRSSAGETYVVFGRDTAADGGFAASLDLSALDGTNGFVINGVDASDVSGLSVSSAGDVNGDGVDDLLIGAIQASPGGDSSAGETYVVFGRDTAADGAFTASLELSALDGSNGFVINGIDASDFSGISVSSAGDVNGDGVDDLLIGAYSADPSGGADAGETYVVFGRDTAADGAFAASLELSALDGSNGFVINGVDASDFSGFSVSSAGDVNGDGVDDLLIGAINANGLAGETYVVFGRDTASDGAFAASFDLSSLDGSNGFVINGIDASDFSGRSLSSAGDVNGDGVDDLLIGAYQAGPNGNGAAGESYVVFGRDTASDGGFAASLDLSALNGTNGFVINGVDAGDQSGHSVASVGDVNGDGVDDLLIGAYQADPSGNSGAGESYVVFGRDTASDGAFAASLDLSTLDGTNGFVINGIDGGDQSGRSVSAAGDVNGDGIDDLLIGARNASPGGDAEAGESYVVFGSVTITELFTNQSVAINLSNTAPTIPVPVVLRAIAEDSAAITITLAQLLANATDANSDTLSVLGLAASSGTLVDNMDDTWSFTPVANDNTFVTFTYSVTDNVAAPVATSATLDLTPVNDLPTITAPGAQSFGFDTTGNQITGLSVGDVDTGTLTITLTVQGALTLAQTTGLTFTAGDGADDSTMTFSGTVANINAAIATLGYVPANGDRDGDQLDIQVGDGGVLITQGAFPASLELSALDGTNGFVINGVDAPDQSGRSVSSAGDVNGDGIDDILIGAYGSAPGGNSVAGESYIVFGRDTSVDGAFAASFELSALDGADGFVINGIDANDYSGWSVSSAGDVNGDGVDDVLIGAFRANGSAGETYVVFGRDTASDGAFAASFELSALDGTNGFVINGIDGNDSSGYSVSSAGDVNGDGIDDLLIGAYLADPGGDSNAGETYVVFGRDTASDGDFSTSLDLSTLDGTNGFVINGIDASDLSGYSVSSAGDVNGDGVDDLLIGAYAADPGGDINAGETYVVFGRNTAAKGAFASSFELSSLDGTNGFVINGVGIIDQSGYSVSSAGDVNGDGVDDILIGAFRGDPDGANDGGETYIVFGRDTASDGAFASSFELSALDGTNGFLINGVDTDDYSGFSVSSLGDVNGDGVDDILIGAYQAAPGGDNSAGESYVVFGRDTASDGAFAASLDLSALDGTNGFIINGIDANDRSGYSVSSAGDVNGDGVNDLLIGAYGAGPTPGSFAGETYVVFGSATITEQFRSQSVTINLSNTAPTVSAPVVLTAIAEDSAAITITLAQLLGNAADANGDTLSVTALTASSGTLVDNMDDTWTFTPADDDDTGVTFNYNVTDGEAPVVATTATLDITPVNDAPTVTGSVVFTAREEDSGVVTITLAQLLANAADVDGDTLSITGLTASSGTLVDNMDDTWTFTPVANDDTSMTFTYSVTDNVAPAVPTTATLDLTPVNDLPTVTAPGAQDFAINSTGNQITGLSVTDVDAGSLTITLTVQGALTLAQTTGLTFTMGDGADDSTMTFSGTVANINAAIATLGYAPANGDRDGDQLDVQVSDGAVLQVAGTFAASLELSALDGTNGFVINGIDASDFSGYSVSSAGDVNGDGVDDILIGARWADPGANGLAGETYVVFGRDTASDGAFAASLELSALDGANGFVINGANAGDESGYSVSSAGDVNGDGIDDLLIGAWVADPGGVNEAGESYVVFGRDTASDGAFAASFELSSLDGTNGFVINGIDTNYQTGVSVSSAGDVNGDGIDDLLIGANQADPSGNNLAGETYVVFGRDTAVDGAFAASLDLSTLDGTNGFVINGVDSGDQSGHSVSSAGDVNGDGVDDLLIGALNADPGGDANAGETYVVFGRDTAVNGAFAASLDLSALDGTNGFVINGIDASDRSGVSVSSAGDVNGDGIDDLLIGAQGGDPSGNGKAGETYVVFGRDTAADGAFTASLDLSTLNGTNGFVINGVDSGDTSGFSVSSAGDVNGDGVDDLLIGAYLAGPSGRGRAGETYVVFGRDTAANGAFTADLDLSSLDGTNGFVINGIDANDRSGFSVSAAGDINGDGVDDLLIGAYNAGPGGDSSAGETYVVFGAFNLAEQFTTQSITINLTNTAPTVSAPVVLTAIDEDSGPVIITAAQLLANSTDANGDALTVSNVTASSGTLVDNMDGTWTYTSVLDDDTGVTFSYTVTDGEAAPIAATATLDLLPVPDSPGDDPLSGGAGSDDVDGGDGFDTLDYLGSTAGVTVDLEAGTGSGGDAEGDTVRNVERLVGSQFDDVLTAAATGSHLYGDVGMDRLIGRAGDDYLVGGAGADEISGGDGFDTADYAGSDFGVMVDLEAGTGLGGHAEGDTLSGIERVFGSTFDDVLTASDEGSDLYGGAGDDDIIGGAGDDFLSGGAGLDTIDGGDGYDTMDYGAEIAGVMVDLDAGVDSTGDTITAVERVFGSGFSDLLIAGASVTDLYGGAGDDIFVTGGGGDILDGESGFDTLDYSGHAQGAVVDLQAGTDGDNNLLFSFERIIGSSFGDNLTAADSGSQLYGEDGDDVLTGGTGSDNFYGGAGADTITGGGGFDTADYSGASGPVTIDLAAGTGTGAEAEGDTLSGIERVIGSSFGDVLIAETIGSDLYGAGGDDTLTGGIGDDLLVGGAGADIIAGGDGFDTVDYSGAIDRMFVDLSDGTASDGDTLAGIERVFGSTFDDVLIAGTPDADLYGGAGDDLLITGDGADLLDGGAGDDDIYFDAADAALGLISGGSGYDWAYNDSDAADTVTLTLAGTGIEGYFGSTGVDIVDGTGSTADLTLRGNGGADQLTGGSGNDYVHVTSDTVNFAGGTGYDYLVFETANGTSLTADLTATGFEGAVGNIGNDSLDASGNTVSASLYGLAGNDTLIGGTTTDYLYGGTGDDQYTGNGGTDYFYHQDTFGNDTITDFVAGTDVMVIRTDGVFSIANMVIIQDGADALLTMGTNTIRLTGVDAATLTDGDFNFPAAPGAEVFEKGPEIATDEGKLESELFVMADYVDLLEIDASTTESAAQMNLAAELIEDSVLGHDAEAWVIDAYGMSML